MSYSTLIESISAAFDQVDKETGTVGRIILTCVRHFGLEHAEKTAKLAEQFPHKAVIGFGMAGEESAGVPGDFAHVFNVARGAGLRITAHAGEFMGPESIRAVVEDLNVERIGHGVRAREEPSLVDELAARRIPLELCPTSNVVMSVVGSIGDHPVKEYLRGGLNVTLSTDDPAFFGVTIRSEYDKVAAAHALGPLDMVEFSRNAIDAAFCSDDIKQRIRREIDDWVSDASGST